MNSHAWIRRLNAQLPGWFIWTSSPGRKWYAVPAPGGKRVPGYNEDPNRIEASTPAELRTLAQQRYSGDDHCESCGVPALECGHRQPERDGARHTI